MLQREYKCSALKAILPHTQETVSAANAFPSLCSQMLSCYDTTAKTMLPEGRKIGRFAPSFLCSA